jgi:hypothetical protein
VTLKIPGDDARVLAQRLWEITPHPGAAPIAVKISDAVSASLHRGRSIDVSEREYGALRRILADHQVAE